jgi:hypothetical protein
MVLQTCYKRLKFIADQAVSISRKKKPPKSRLRHHTTGRTLHIAVQVASDGVDRDPEGAGYLPGSQTL